jgi:hypothetical protein
MNILFSLSEHIEEKMITFFHDNINMGEMSVFFKHYYSDLFENYLLEEDFYRPKCIEGLFSKYKATNQTIEIYLPVVFEYCNQIGRPFISLLKILLFYEIGRWVFHTYRYENRQLSFIQFRNLDENLVNLFSLSICFHCIRNKRADLKTFRMLTESLDTNYLIFNDFYNLRYNLTVPEISEINEFLKSGIIQTKDSYNTDLFDHYFDSILEVNPTRIVQLMPILSNRLKEKWEHLSPDFGFFPE